MRGPLPPPQSPVASSRGRPRVLWVAAAVSFLSDVAYGALDGVIAHFRIVPVSGCVRLTRRNSPARTVVA